MSEKWNPKEKAQNLIDKIMDFTPVDYPLDCTGDEANKIALADMSVCKNIARVFISEIKLVINSYSIHSDCSEIGDIDFWESVEREVDLL